MDIYSTLASWTGWPAVAAFMLLAGGLIYWALNNRIETYKETIEELKENTPDVIVKRLAFRHKVAIDELERLNADHEASQELIYAKEVELAGIRNEIEVLRNQLEKTDELLSVIFDNELLCPYCGAPLTAKQYAFGVMDDGDGGDIDVELGYIRYECGYMTANGYEQTECSRKSKNT